MNNTKAMFERECNPLNDTKSNFGYWIVKRACLKEIFFWMLQNLASVNGVWNGHILTVFAFIWKMKNLTWLIGEYKKHIW